MIITKKLMMVNKKFILLLLVLISMNSLFSTDYTIYQWRRRNLPKYAYNGRAEISIPLDRTYKEAWNKVYFRGSYIKFDTRLYRPQGRLTTGTSPSSATVADGKSVIVNFGVSYKYGLFSSWKTADNIPITFIADRTAPTSIFTDKDVNSDSESLSYRDSKFLYLDETIDLHRKLYFNSNEFKRDLTVFWSHPKEYGSGLKSINIIDNGTSEEVYGTEKSFSQSEIIPEKTFSLGLYDRVGNYYNKSKISLIEDIKEPTFASNSINYFINEEIGYADYEISIPYFDIKDNINGSGVKNYHLYLDDIPVKVDHTEGLSYAVNNKLVYDSPKIKLFNRDQIYNVSSFFRDNVFNKSRVDIKEVMLSAPATIDDGGTTFGKTPQYVYRDGILYFEGYLDLGDKATHPELGIEKIDLYIAKNDTERFHIGTVDNILDDNPNIKIDENRIDSLDNPVNGKEIKFSFPVNVSDLGLEYHKSYVIEVETTHKGSTGLEPKRNILPEVSEYRGAPLPDRDILGTIINVNGKNILLNDNNHKIISNDTTAKEMIRLTESDSFQNLFVKENFQIKTVKKNDEDNISFKTLDYENNGVFYLVITESYTKEFFDAQGNLQSEGVSNSYLLTKYKFTKDPGIDTKEVNVVIDGDKNVSNSSDVKVKLNRVPYDLSGIKEIVYFNVPTNSILENQSLLFDISEIEKLYNNFYNNDSPDIKKVKSLEGQTISNVLTDFKLIPPNENEGKAYVSARLKDNAGNVRYLIPTTILVDTVAPNGVTVNDLKYSYSHLNSENTIRLSIDTGYAVSAFIREKPVNIINNEIIIPLGTSFIHNEKVDIKVTLTDKAGNRTVNYLWFYTPSKITASDIEVNHSWDEILGNVLQFNNKQPEAGIVTYKNNVNINNKDTKLNSHGKYIYTFYSVNGSGYENQRSGTFVTPMEIEVPNNKPTLTLKDEYVYLGPETEITFDTNDRDNDLLKVLVKHESFLDSQGVLVEGGSFTLNDVFNSNLSIFNENLSNKVSIGVQDFWGTDNMFSGDHIWNDLEFIYDSTPPVIDSFKFETKADYTFVNGRLLFNISDTGVGLDRSTVKVTKFKDNTEETLSVSTLTGSEYVYSVVLPEGSYDIEISAADLLGNSNKQLLDKSIVVDKTKPLINNVIWGDNPNLPKETNTLSSRNSNFYIQWEDNVSSPAFIEYKFVNNGIVTNSGVKDVKGLSEPSKNIGALNFNIYNDSPALVEGTLYELSFKIIDRAGHSSTEYKLPFNISYDLTSPEINLQSWALTNRNGKFYTNIDILPNPIVNISDNSSFVTTYKLTNSITGEDSQEVNNFSLLKPTVDGQYELQIIAIDSMAHKSALKIPFIYDSVEPQNIKMTLLDTKKSLYKGGEELNVEFSGDGVDTYYYQILNQETNEVLSNNYQGAEQGWVKVDSSIATNYKLKLPRFDSADKITGIVKIKASDYAGNSSPELVPQGANFDVDSSGEYINIALSPWVGSDRKLKASWTYFLGENNNDSSVNSYKYEVYSENQGVETKIGSGDTQVPNLEYQLPDTVISSDKFFIKVSAIMSSSRETEFFNSTTIKIDTVSPVINSVTANKSSSQDSIKVSWDVSDNVIISQIKAAISWSYLKDGVFVTEYSDIINLGQELIGDALLTSFDSSLIKTGDRVKVNLIVEDGAGNTTSQFSNEIIVDNTPPPEFVVNDHGDYVNPSLNPELTFDWIWAEEDQDSPIANLYYQVTKSGVLTENWIEIDKTVKEITVPIPEYLKSLTENGSLLVLAVKKVNSAGLSTIGFSDGIVLDSTAGKIVEAVFTFRDSLDPRKFYTNTRDLTLWVSGYDEESGISRLVGELGTLSGDTWINQNSGKIDEINHDGKLDLTLPNVINDSDRFRYKVVWYNKTGTPSTPFYTRELVYNPKKPELLNVTGSYNNSLITLTWDHILQLPFKEGKITLKSDTLNKEFIITDNIGVFTLDTHENNIPDGEYSFSIEIFDAADGSTGVKKSNSFIMDSSKPELVELDADTFISENLSFTLKANESLSYYSYKIGTVSNDTLFTGGWIDGQSSGSSVSIDNYDLTRLSNINVVDQSCILLTVKFADVSGNWSDLHTALIRVDLTPPEKPVVSVSRDHKFYEHDISLDRSISFSNSIIKNVKWDSIDDLSHIAGYSYTVVNSTSEVIPDSSWSKVIPVDKYGNYNVDLNGLSLTDNNEVYVAMKAVNGAGLHSEVGYSEEILVDNSAPEFTFNTTTEAGKTVIDGFEYSTYNDNSDIDIDIANEASNHIYAKVKIYDPQNKLIVDKKSYKDITANKNLKIPFVPTEGVFGKYVIDLEIEDPGLNSNTMLKTIRYNPPPIINSPVDEITVNPLRPYRVEGKDWFNDTDGIKSIVYKVLDGQTVTQEQTSLAGFDLVLEHKNIISQETHFTLRIVASDNFGNKSEVDIPVKVVNTTEGRLYTDEYWSGNHTVQGSIIIPAGKTLTVDSGTEIKIDTNSVNGYNQRITVEQNGNLVHEGAAKYYSDDTHGNWDGLLIMGSANLSSLHIEGANRGITIDSTEDYIINSSIFVRNSIGLHLVRSGQLSIENSIFKLNNFYGIKEEKGTDPVVKSSRFSGNGYDYYDSEFTVIDLDKLNSINANSGNIGE